jgi:murein DD-endopeptidase MepM/ murein hydrolase activator NlpD
MWGENPVAAAVNRGLDQPGRRARALRLVVSALVSAGLGLGVTVLLPGVAAATSTGVPEAGAELGTATGELAERRKEQRQDALLAEAVRERSQALDAIDAAAEEYADGLEAEMARLAALGYTGELQDLTHVLPLAGYRLSAGFGLAGPLWEASHTGQDFAGSLGTTLVAVGDGVVTSVGDAGPYGLRTVLTLDDGTDLWYAHQLSALVQPGEVVKVGQPIGLLGSTGNSTGPHLHLEVRPAGGGAVDPAAWLAALGLAI